MPGRYLKYIAISLLLFLSPASASEEVASPRAVETRTFAGGLFQTGDLYLAGQPLTAQALEELQAAGVNHVINLRTPEEIANPKASPIHVESVSRQLGLNYTHLPTGGAEHPYSPATVDSLADLLEDADGRVLLHCASGRRATHLWVAYLIRHLGMDAQEAINLGQAARFGQHAVEGYLGKSLRYSVSP